MLVASPTAPVGAQWPELSPDSGTVAAGGSLTARPTGCESEGGTSRFVEAILVTGSGGDERLAAYGRSVGDGSYTFAVPEWVDPADPAVLAGRCVEVTGGPPPGPPPVIATAFTYADVPIDVTPGAPGVSGPTFQLDRDAAEGGQVLLVNVVGCPIGTRPSAWLLAGDDMSGRSGRTETAAASSPSAGEAVVLVLNRPTVDGVPSPPVQPGTYRVEAACGVDEDPSIVVAPAVRLAITASNPTDSLSARAEGTDLIVRGEGCTGGRQVVLRTTVRSMDPETGGGGEEERTSVALPAPDGSWSVALPLAGREWQLVATADCGFPDGDGFRYSELITFGTAPEPGPEPEPEPEPGGTTTPGQQPTADGSAPTPSAPDAQPVVGSPTYTG